MNLSTEHKALFSLLRAGLWEREADDLSPFPLTDAQWWEVYRMSVRQTVAGIGRRHPKVHPADRGDKTRHHPYP